MVSIAVPGQLIGSLSSHQPGPRTHVFDGEIYASTTGSISTTPAPGKSSRATISISPSAAATQTAPSSSATKLPAVGSTVLCRILRVQQRQSLASILLVDPTTASINLYSAATDDELQSQAILRREDVRAYEKDKIVMNDMYRVGDIVRASIISLGDERNYYISTAGNEFGVVIAKSEDGGPMVPTSWKEMRDVVTGKAESRKVAKPD